MPTTPISAEQHADMPDISRHSSSRTLVSGLEQSHFPSPSSPLPNFPHLHPTHPAHPSFSAQQTPISSSATSPTVTSKSVLSSKSVINTKPINTENSPKNPKPLSSFKENLPYWVRRLHIGREKEKAKQQIENVYKALLNKGDLCPLIKDLFNASDDQQSDVLALNNLLMTTLSENSAGQKWVLPSAVATATVLSQICEGDLEQAKQVLERMNKPLDIFGRKSENTEVEEKAWQCMQRLASAKKYGLAAVLKLQNMEPANARLKGISKEAALIAFLQAQHKLCCLDPTRKATPSPWQVDAEPSNIKSRESLALLTIDAARIITKETQRQETLEKLQHQEALQKSQTLNRIKKIGTRLAPINTFKQPSIESKKFEPNLAPEKLAAIWFWQQGFDENHANSKLNECLHMLVEPVTTWLENSQEQGHDQLSGFDLLKHDVSRAHSNERNPWGTNHLLDIDYVSNTKNRETFNSFINQAIERVCLHLEAQLPQITDANELAQAALNIAKLRMWQTVQNKGYGDITKVDKKFAKAILEYAEFDLIKKRKPPEGSQRESYEEVSKKNNEKIPETINKTINKTINAAINEEACEILRKKAKEETKKLTQDSGLLDTFRKEIGKLPLFSWVSPSVSVEKLFNIAGLTELAKQLSAHPSSADNTTWKAKFDGSIKEAQELVSGTQTQLKNQDEIKDLGLKILREPPGTSISGSEGAEKGFSLGFAIGVSVSEELPSLALSFGPDLGFTVNDRSSYKIDNNSDHGLQLTFSNSQDYSGRLGLIASAGYKGGNDNSKALAGATLTTGPRAQVKRINTVVLQADKPMDSSAELNDQQGDRGEKMIPLYNDAAAKTICEWKAKHGDVKSIDSEAFLDLFGQELAVSFFHYDYSLRTTQFQSERAEVAAVGRLGIHAGQHEPDRPIAGVSGGVTLKAGFSKHRLFDKTGTQQKIAQGTGKDITANGVFGVSLRFLTTIARIPLNKTLWRKTLWEKKILTQTKVVPDPTDPFSQKVLFERETEDKKVNKRNRQLKSPAWEKEYEEDTLNSFLEQEHTTSNTKWALLERREMNDAYRSVYNTFSTLNTLRELHQEALQGQQQISVNKESLNKIKKNLGDNKTQIKAYSKAMVNLTAIQEIREFVGLRSHRIMTEETSNGVSFWGKVKHIQSKQRGSEEKWLYGKSYQSKSSKHSR